MLYLKTNITDSGAAYARARVNVLERRLDGTLFCEK